MGQKFNLERLIHAFRTELRDPNGPRTAAPNDLLLVWETGMRLTNSAPDPTGKPAPPLCGLPAES